MYRLFHPHGLIQQLIYIAVITYKSILFCNSTIQLNVIVVVLLKTSINWTLKNKLLSEVLCGLIKSTKCEVILLLTFIDTWPKSETQWRLFNSITLSFMPQMKMLKMLLLLLLITINTKTLLRPKSSPNSSHHFFPSNQFPTSVELRFTSWKYL